ncbi:MAG: Hsp20/alpha crystallin family protein [Pseudomonadota bacterium]
MSTLDQIRDGFHHAMDYVAEGWRKIQQQAAHALTRFTPTRSQGNLETAEDQLVQSSPGWGLLASEMKEEAKNITVRMEIPGMDAENFDIEVVNNILVVRGEKKVQREQNTGRYFLLERAYGRFERAIRLPAEVDDSRAKAEYKNGVLSIILPKSAKAESRRVIVKTDR